LGGLTLGVGEIGRHGDDRVGHGLTEVGLGVLLQLAQGAGRDLLRGVLLVVDLGGPLGPHVALDRGDGAVDVGDGLTLGDLTDQDLALLGEGDDRGGRARALGVGDHGGLPALEDGDGRVGGAEVDSDDTRHKMPAFLRRCAPRWIRALPVGRGGSAAAAVTPLAGESRRRGWRRPDCGPAARLSDSGSSRGLSRAPVKLALTELEYTMLNLRLVALIPPQPTYDGGHVRQVPRTLAAITSV